MYVYQKFTKCPAFGIFKIHIRTLQKHTSWEGLRDVKYCFTESHNGDTCTVCMVMNVVEMWGSPTRWTYRIKKIKQSYVVNYYVISINTNSTESNHECTYPRYNWLQTDCNAVHFICSGEVFPLTISCPIKWHDVKHCTFWEKLQHKLAFILCDFFFLSTRILCVLPETERTWKPAN